MASGAKASGRRKPAVACDRTPAHNSEKGKCKMKSERYRSQSESVDSSTPAAQSLEEAMQVLDDIRRGIDDLEAGRYRPLREVDAELRSKHNISQDV
jgi:predicted transcriptional regulator